MNGDIEIEIGAGSGAGNYAVRVISAAAGGEPAGTLELDVDELLSRRDVLEATVLASAVGRRSVSASEQPVRELGRQLFRALFAGPVYGTYRASLAAAQHRGKRLRLVLRLTAPELAALPWEMLFDPETETYLCRQEPLVRHVPAPYTAEPLEVRSQLRILGLVASPRGLQALDVEAEKKHLAQALAGPVADGLVELVWAPQATWDGVHAELLADEWHVLHFVGHGDYDTTTDEGVLALVGRDGRADMVEAGRLADLLGEAQPTPQLVVLNSCSSGQTGANDLFSGTAAALVRSGISAVAAMQYTVSDTAAVAFARGFYTAIARGRSVDEAARSGRISILGTRGSLEWVTPVLYVRGQATQLFTLSPSRAGGRESPPGHQATEPIRRRRAELNALYVEAKAKLRLGHFDTAIGLVDDLLILDPGYPGAAGLRDTARRGQQLANTYTLATEAEDAGDWAAAVRGYEEVLGLDPAYRDAAGRKEACQARQQVADLQAELRHHADSGQWQAVLDADAELAGLDPSAADPDGLATRARDALAAEQRAADLERRYAEARAAEASGDWAAAVRGYEEVLRFDPAYRDAAGRKEACQARQQVADLQAELRHHADSGQWQAVLDADAELAGLDPSAADPDGLATRARDALAAEQRAADLERRYAEARAAEASGDWAAAVRGYEEVLGLDPAYQDAAARREFCREAAAATPLSAERAARFRAKDASHFVQPILRIDSDKIVRAVSWHPDGRHIAVANEDVRRLGQVRRGDARNAAAGIAAANESADGAADRRPDVRVYDLSGGKAKVQLAITASDLAAAYGAVAYDVAFSPDGTRLATAAGNARIWDAASGEQLLEIRGFDFVVAVAFSADGTRLATAAKTARIWNATTGKKLLEVSHEISALRRAIDTRFGTAKPAPRSASAAFMTGEESIDLQAIAFSSDGARLATGSRDGSARVWDARSGKKLIEVRNEVLMFVPAVSAVAFSPDGTRLATGGSDAQIWDASTGIKLLEFRHPGVIDAIAFSPSGTRLATGSWNGNARVWDATSGEMLLEIRHDSDVTAVSFSPDGYRLATGSKDKSVQIWPVADL